MYSSYILFIKNTKLVPSENNIIYVLLKFNFNIYVAYLKKMLY